MGVLMKFLLDNYICFAFAAILLVLALIGYIVDTTKTEKLKKKYSKEEDEKDMSAPVLAPNIKLGETVSKVSSESNATVNAPLTKSQPVSTGTPANEPEKK